MNSITNPTTFDFNPTTFVLNSTTNPTVFDFNPICLNVNNIQYSNPTTSDFNLNTNNMNLNDTVSTANNIILNPIINSNKNSLIPLPPPLNSIYSHPTSSISKTNVKYSPTDEEQLKQFIKSNPYINKTNFIQKFNSHQILTKLDQIRDGKCLWRKISSMKKNHPPLQQPQQQHTKILFVIPTQSHKLPDTLIFSHSPNLPQINTNANNHVSESMSHLFVEKLPKQLPKVLNGSQLNEYLQTPTIHTVALNSVSSITITERNRLMKLYKLEPNNFETCFANFCSAKNNPSFNSLFQSLQNEHCGRKSPNLILFTDLTIENVPTITFMFSVMYVICNM